MKINLKNSIKSLIIISLISIFCISCNTDNTKSNNEFPAKKFRYVICTDMTHDDDNSMIRLLRYSNEIDIEAVIVTDQGPETQRIEDWPNKMWNRVQGIYDAYELVVDNLRLHDPNFPDADYFRKITKQGKGTAQRMTGSSDNGQEKFWDYVGEDRDSEGSDYLIEVFEKEDNRPIYIGFWGGSITFAQAMWRYNQSHTPEKVQALLDKMIFHCISFQDITFDMFIDLDGIEKNAGTSKPFYGDFDGERLIPAKILADGNNFWKYIGAINVEKVHELSGPLGDLYDEGGEGDTPSFLNLISMNLGLSDITKPEYGGWGDMFQEYPLKNVWLANPNKPEGLIKWLPAATNSFYARCLWEEKDYESCNHSPVAGFKGDTSYEFVYIEAQPGEKIVLDAKGSTDPDGDKLNYKWWHYNEADSYEESVTIENNESEKTEFIIPDDSKGKNIHIIFEVNDSGSPMLTAYRRIIISAK